MWPVLAEDAWGPSAVIGLIGAIVAGVVTIVKVLRESKRRDDLTDRRVDLLWDAAVRRGHAESSLRLKSPQLSEGVVSSGATAELVIRPDVRAAYRPIADTLRAVRRRNPGITQSRFFELVEEHYGDWMMRHICVPLGVTNFACLAAAWDVSEEPEEGT